MIKSADETKLEQRFYKTCMGVQISQEVMQLFKSKLQEFTISEDYIGRKRFI